MTLGIRREMDRPKKNASPATAGRLRAISNLIFAIMVHGPGVVFDYLPFVRGLYQNEFTSWMEIAEALRENGMPEAEIWAINHRHNPRGCACWECIGRLQAWIVRTSKATDEAAAGTGGKGVGQMKQS